LALSGLFGLPGFDLLKNWIKSMFGEKDVELELKSLIGKSNLPAAAKRTILYGALSNLGIDVGRRVGMGERAILRDKVTHDRPRTPAKAGVLGVFGATLNWAEIGSIDFRSKFLRSKALIRACPFQHNIYGLFRVRLNLNLTERRIRT
jgi:hypothetical protein